MILAILSTCDSDASYQVQDNRLFISGEETKNKFSRWQPWRPSWIIHRNNFSNFFIYKSPRCFLPSFMSIGLSVAPDATCRVTSQLALRFRRRGCGGHLEFPIGKILAILIYKSTRCFQPSFESIGLLVQEKKRKIDFQDGYRGGHLGFRIRTILAMFDL